MNKLELKQNLEINYPHTEARLKRIECIYIPVTNAELAKHFFMKYGLITLSTQGNVKLASGQGIFFLETTVKQTANFVTHDWDDQDEHYVMEAACFEVTQINELYQLMKEDGAKVSELKDNSGCGWSFHFFDPDGNKFAAWQDVN
ncbi:VOC family protein [Paenibacillus sp. OV219]|uniref:VOC family protein n=1 Tax=Paenibacillus sp. OV219 TaxID=1884377 RepID=UPI0008C9D1B2|nr:hypothetical protein [Paenibacillus sp. OV219]SEM67097.1 RNA polymerase sigma-70 factor, ECF subfamily [Paenibacillus sp. OV219]